MRSPFVSVVSTTGNSFSGTGDTAPPQNPQEIPTPKIQIQKNGIFLFGQRSPVVFIRQVYALGQTRHKFAFPSRSALVNFAQHGKNVRRLKLGKIFGMLSRVSPPL